MSVDYGVLQCVAMCCSVLQCVAVCCSVCCSVLQHMIVDHTSVDYELQCAAVCCSVLQCAVLKATSINQERNNTAINFQLHHAVP